MFRNHLYYALKPLLPWSVRMGVRRWFARRKRARVSDVWPILPGSEKPPAGWPGWPDGKQFAFVLTHDVEGPEGLAKVKQLAELEMSLGFRSSFNFIPEGQYRVPAELRDWLTSNGFEVGVHDLNHDGKLYRNGAEFTQKAVRINHYLKDWGAVGFRSGFMLRNLDWLHQLNVQYEASTFDTDPFEPQPDGTGTIFPFWVSRNQKTEIGKQKSDSSGNPELVSRNTQPATRSSAPLSTSGPPLSECPPSAPNFNVSACQPVSVSASAPSESQLSAFCSQHFGYVELPYTLPQDSTLFLLLREKTPEIWLKKLDWIAQHGGMALVNVHPDYLQFPGEPASRTTFPLEFYTQLLEHVRKKYGHSYCQPLARELPALILRQVGSAMTSTAASRGPVATQNLSSGKKIWIDLENTPHIPFFKPIMRELEQRGHTVVLTARDAYQTCEMADRYGFNYTRIGHHYGKNRLFKTWGVFVRSAQLLPFALREKPSLALNHGSRTQNHICNLLGIPTVSIMDYEHTSEAFLWRPRWELGPSVLREEDMPNHRHGEIRKYSGIKEDVYVPDFKPDPAILPRLGLDPKNIIVTVRPPATEAHYHNPEAETLFEAFMIRLSAASGVQAVLLPRNKRQENQIRAGWPQWFTNGKTTIPDGVVEGLNLLWHSDLVVSGGGTMNREAAALGVPVYSIFRGQIGAVDRHLQSEGRLTLIETVQDVHDKIPLRARPKAARADFPPRKALGEIVAHLEDILKHHCAR